MSSNENKSTKVGFLSQMSTKITIVSWLIAVIALMFLVIFSVSKSTKTLTETYKNSALNLAEEAVIGVDFATEFGEQAYGGYAMNLAQEAAVAINFSDKLKEDGLQKADYDKLLGDIEITGVEGSYAYMVSPDGTMLWHPTADKIGNPVENAAVKGIVSELQAGKTVEDDFVIYEYKGALKLAGYSFTDAGNIILVTGDYDKLINIDYDSLIGEIVIDGVEGSYAYMVSPDGTMLYHSTPEKIGQPVENDAVKNIVSKLSAGQTVPNEACTYKYKGADKLAGYAFTKAGNIVVVTGDLDVMLKPVHKMRNLMIIISVITSLILIVVIAVFTKSMLSGLSSIIPVINKTADLDFSKNSTTSRLAKRSDEIGAIAKALSRMQDSLHEIVESIDMAGSSVNNNVDDLQNTIDSVGIICQDNSATTEELAAGMQETANTTSLISKTVENVQSNTLSISKLADDGTELSGKVLERAKNLYSTTEQASQKTITIYETVKVKSDEAILASQAVNKINELTETIMNISSQTRLLALNASIEAARAGEEGRGFAVVASEISSLANQTEEAIKNIDATVTEVNQAVVQLSECLEEMTGFLEKNVLSDYQEFGKVSEQYKIDADVFGESMSNIKQSIVALNSEIDNIVDAINGIDNNVSDASTGVTNIAEKTSDMVSETTGSVDKVMECKEAIGRLNDIINQFKL